MITTRTQQGKLEGLTANSFSSVSLDPPLVLWSLRKDAPSLENFRRSGYFAVNVLAMHQHQYCRHFAKSALNKFADVAHETGIGGCPILPGSLACFECSMHQLVDAGDHLILIGRVEKAVHRDGEPLIFSGGAFWTAAPYDHGGSQGTKYAGTSSGLDRNGGLDAKNPSKGEKAAC